MAMTTERPRSAADLHCPRCNSSGLSNVHDYDTDETVVGCLACGWSGDPETYVAQSEPDTFRWVQVWNGGMPIRVPHISRFLGGTRSTGLLCGKYATASLKAFTIVADVQRGEQRDGACTICQTIVERHFAGGVVSVESGPATTPPAVPAPQSAAAAPTIDPEPTPAVVEPAPPIAIPATPDPEPERLVEPRALLDLDDPLDGFELYTQRSTRIPETVVRVTLDRSGNLRLSPAAFAAIGGPETVQLLYHAGRRRIAVRRCEAGTDGALKPRSKRGRGESFTISAEGFCKRFGVAFETARELPATVVASVLVLDLEPADVRG